jgi:OTU domain-containing protein 6
LEEEYAVKLQEMEQRHEEEMAAIQKELDGTTPQVVDDDDHDEQAPNPDNAEKELRERKREKARRKLLQKLEQQKQLQEEQERDLAGPSARKQELELLQEQLDPLQLEIMPVASDGHCLYRAVSEQCDQTYLELRTYILLERLSLKTTARQ